MNLSSSKCLSVTELANQLNHFLQSEFPLVTFKGEISQFSVASSGHLYFTLKDEQSQLSAVMWKGSLAQLGFQPKQGLEVVCSGKPNLYPGSGKLQMIVTRMEEAGEGLLRKRFLELKAKLEREGLFDPSRKRSIPFMPRGIGIVTSKSGAAIHDIMTKITERMPNVPVYLYDARVQGEGSVDEIVAGIRHFQNFPEVDVLIVGRGGGSLEDLWSFNEEKVARAIFSSVIPVISAVGHEVDVSLSDLVADVRAPTPTAAGEMVVPSREEILRQLSRNEERLKRFDRWFLPYMQRVDDIEQRLYQRTAHSIERAKAFIEGKSGTLKSIRPDRVLAQLRLRIDGHSSRLKETLQKILLKRGERLAKCEMALSRHSPALRMEREYEKLDYIQRRLRSAVSVRIDAKRFELEKMRSLLEALSYEAILGRGFSLIQHDGRIVKDASTLQIGSSVEMKFAIGSASAHISRIYGDPKRASSRGAPSKKVELGSGGGSLQQGELFLTKAGE